jgi:hypothetical protein
MIETAPTIQSFAEDYRPSALDQSRRDAETHSAAWPMRVTRYETVIAASERSTTAPTARAQQRD